VPAWEEDPNSPFFASSTGSSEVDIQLADTYDIVMVLIQARFSQPNANFQMKINGKSAGYGLRTYGGSVVNAASKIQIGRAANGNSNCGLMSKQLLHGRITSSPDARLRGTNIGLNADNASARVYRNENVNNNLQSLQFFPEFADMAGIEVEVFGRDIANGGYL